MDMEEPLRAPVPSITAIPPVLPVQVVSTSHVLPVLAIPPVRSSDP